MDAWCEVIYNGMLGGPQGQFRRRHMMGMNGSWITQSCTAKKMHT